MRSRPLLAIVTALLVTAAASAHADRIDPATALRQEGLKAAQDKNWEVARERFEQSYALDPRPLTLFNLAVAQEHTDRLIEASASYAAFLEQPATRNSEPFRKLARDAIPALDRAIPTLQIRTSARLPDDAIELDGRPATTSAAIPLDPGAHTVAVRRGRDPVAQRTVTLVRAAREEVEIVVPAPPPPPPRIEPPPEPAMRLTFERTPPPPPPRSSSLLRSGWFWGVTAVVVAAAAGAGYYYLALPTHAPTQGTLGPPIPVP
jgi:hypothetical protein